MPQLQSSAPAGAIKKLTKGTAIPGGRVRGLLVGTEGTANLTDGSGNVCTNVPLVKGYNPIEITVLATGGTADDIWGIY